MCRDQHVRVNYLNVLPDKWIDYSWNPLQFPLDTEYDCDSIMHYRDTSFNIGNSITLEVSFYLTSLLIFLSRQLIPPDVGFVLVQIDRPARTSILSTNFTIADKLPGSKSRKVQRIQPPYLYVAINV